METVEVAVQIEKDGSIHLPKDVAARLPKDHPVQAVFLLDADSEEAWPTWSARNFLAGYAPEDSIYDQA